MTAQSQWVRRDSLPIEAKSDAGRVPPHDLDAEAAVLAAVLLERAALERVLPLLKPEMFYSDANRRIFEAVVDLAATGAPVDITTVAAWLRSREWINQIGGASYLVQLVDATPSVANVASHAHIVVEKHRLRRAIGCCQQFAAEGYGDIGGTVDEFIGKLEQSARVLLRAAPGRQAAQSLGDILAVATKKIEETCQRRQAGLASRELVESRYPNLDAKLVGGGFARGNVYIIGARPGMGKTSVAANIATNVCALPTNQSDPNFQEVEHAAFFWSGEMPREQLGIRIACSESGISFDRAWRGELTPAEWKEHIAAVAWLSSLKIIIDDKPSITVSELEAKVREARAEWERPADPSKQQRERRLSLVVIDYITLMRGTGKEGNREQEIAGISRGLKELAKTMDVPVIVLAQLNRAVEARGVTDRRPNLSDLRESGQIEQDGDMIAFMHRPVYYKPDDERLRGIAELIIRKQRNGVSNCTVYFSFDGPRMRFGTPDRTLMSTISEVYAHGAP